MSTRLYASQVMAALADRLGTATRTTTRTPFGVPLQPAWGTYAVGQHVSAPGLDDCSPRLECEVMAVGRRPDQAGVWCLLRGLDRHGGFALVHQDDLRPVDEARVASHDALATSLRPGRSPGAAAVMRPLNASRQAAALQASSA